MCSNRFARGPFYLHAQQFSGRVTDLVGTLQQARWIRPKYQNNAAVCPGWMVCSPLFCDLPFGIYPYWHRTSAAKGIGRFTYSPRDWQIRPGPLQAGRPTTLSGHMCRFPFYRKANEKFSAPWPRVHWAYFPGRYFVNDQRTPSKSMIFWRGSPCGFQASPSSFCTREFQLWYWWRCLWLWKAGIHY